MKLTDRQRTALDELVVQARSHGVEIRHAHEFVLHYRDEVRPGRGHDVVAHYIDSDHVVVAYVDVYGNGDGASIGEVSWVHEASVGDCSCAACEFGLVTLTPKPEFL